MTDSAPMLAIALEKHGKGDKGDEKPMPAPKEPLPLGLSAAAQDFLDAVKADNAEKVARAFMDMDAVMDKEDDEQKE